MARCAKPLRKLHQKFTSSSKMNTDPATETQLITGEIMGQKTDFHLESTREGTSIKLTVSTVFPFVDVQDGVIVSYPPPRWPWTP